MFHKTAYSLVAVTLSGVFFVSPWLSNAADDSMIGTRPAILEVASNVKRDLREIRG